MEWSRDGSEARCAPAEDTGELAGLRKLAERPLVSEEPTPNQRLLHAQLTLEGTDWLQTPAGWVGPVGQVARF